MNGPHVVCATTLAFASVVGTATASPIEYADQDRFVSVSATDQPGPPYAREDRSLITGEFGSDLSMSGGSGAYAHAVQRSFLNADGLVLSAFTECSGSPNTFNHARSVLTADFGLTQPMSFSFTADQLHPSTAVGSVALTFQGPGVHESIVWSTSEAPRSLVLGLSPGSFHLFLEVSSTTEASPRATLNIVPGPGALGLALAALGLLVPCRRRHERVAACGQVASRSCH